MKKAILLVLCAIMAMSLMVCGAKAEGRSLTIAISAEPPTLNPFDASTDPTFQVSESMFETLLGESPYKSPTDMGVNMAGNCIFDDEAVRDAANAEIIRRYYDTLCRKQEYVLLLTGGWPPYLNLKSF